MSCIRQVMNYTAALSFLLVLACSKQSEEDASTGAGAPPGANGGDIFAGSNDSPLGGSSAPPAAADPNAVGEALPLTPAQVSEITTSKSVCNAWVSEPETGPGRLLLLVDISSSMNSSATGTNGQSKWDVTRRAIVEAVCGNEGDPNNPGLGSGTSVSLMFYPNQKNEQTGWDGSKGWTACFNANGVTPMALLGGFDANSQRTLLRNTIMNVQLGFGTPTAGAYDYAVNNILLQDTNAGTPYIVLITDGMPTLDHNCSTPSGSIEDLPASGTQEIVNLVKMAAAAGVKSFMIGTPGSEKGRAWMSQAAYDGGTGKAGCAPGNANGPYCHMDMTTSSNLGADLRAGLDSIIAQVVSCDFDIPTEAADGSGQKTDLNRISPIILFSNGTAELLTRDAKNGEACTEGFYIASATRGKFCTNTCSRVMSDATAKTRLLFGCSSQDTMNTILQ